MARGRENINKQTQIQIFYNKIMQKMHIFLITAGSQTLKYQIHYSLSFVGLLPLYLLKFMISNFSCTLDGLKLLVLTCHCPAFLHHLSREDLFSLPFILTNVCGSLFLSPSCDNRCGRRVG